MSGSDGAGTDILRHACRSATLVGMKTRDQPGAWAAGIYWLSTAVLALVAWTAVAVCDACGEGGDALFKALAVVSWLLATAFVIALFRSSRAAVAAVLFAGQFATALAAYKLAGAGAGKIHVSDVFVVIALVGELCGAAALVQRYRPR